MHVKNRYAHRAKISEAKVRQVVKLFTQGVNATRISELARLNRNSANKYLMGIREAIARSCENEAPAILDLEFGAYFLDLGQDEENGDKRTDKSFAVAGSAESQRVYAKFFPLETDGPLWDAVARRIYLPQRESHASTWRCYEDFGYRKYFQASGDEASGTGWQCRELIEAFWAGAKERFIALRGVPSHTFYLHLKECEFRFNHRDKALARIILRMLEATPLGGEEGTG